VLSKFPLVTSPVYYLPFSLGFLHPHFSSPKLIKLNKKNKKYIKMELMAFRCYYQVVSQPFQLLSMTTRVFEPFNLW